MLTILLACDPEDSAAPKPATLSVSLSPADPRTDDVLTATVEAEVAFTLAWTVDGRGVGDGGETLDGSWFSRGQLVEVEVRGEDGGVARASVSVANSAPVLGDVSIQHTLDGEGADRLACSATATDPDDDAVSFAYAWSVDGVAFSTEAELGAEEVSRGREWTCTVTAADDADSGEPGSETVSLSGPAPGQYAWEKVMDLFPPADLVALDDGQLLVAGMDGVLYRVDPASASVTGSAVLYDHYDDLIAIALHPDFGDGVHDHVYAWGNTSCTLLRWPLDLDSFSLGEQQTVLEFPCGGGDGHCGGDIQWWDGEGETLLYLSTGPAGGADPQDSSDLGGGKIVALRVDDETGEGSGAFDVGFEDSRVAAIGFRNPWRLTDCGEALCVADPGGEDFDEVDVYTAAGQNFGFPYFEGYGDGSYEEPFAAWDRVDTTYVLDDRTGPGEAGFIHAPTVGPRLSGRGYGGRLEGWAFYNEIYDGWVRAREILDDGSAGEGDVDIAHLQWVLSFEEGADGTVYAADMAGALWKLVHRGDRPRIGEPGEALSASHFPEAVPYEVQHALWSNGAGKQRYVWIPEGETIDSSGDPWIYPEGTRFYKTFTWEGENVETRVIEKRDGRWLGGVYLWEGDDAYLTDGTRIELTLPDGSWYALPGETSCFDCHEATRGDEWPRSFLPHILGDSELDAFAGSFSEDPGPAPVIEGDETEQWVRGYLDVNCGFCHQPEGLTGRTTVLTFDLRYDADLSGLDEQVAQYYEANPNLDNGKLLIDPEKPEESVLVQVMEEDEMPYVGVWTADTEAIAILQEWIGGQRE